MSFFFGSHGDGAVVVRAGRRLRGERKYGWGPRRARKEGEEGEERGQGEKGEARDVGGRRCPLAEESQIEGCPSGPAVVALVLTTEVYVCGLI
jgi:hypothetical protein